MKITPLIAVILLVAVAVLAAVNQPATASILKQEYGIDTTDGRDQFLKAMEVTGLEAPQGTLSELWSRDEAAGVYYLIRTEGTEEIWVNSSLLETTAKGVEGFWLLEVHDSRGNFYYRLLEEQLPLDLQDGLHSIEDQGLINKALGKDFDARLMGGNWEVIYDSFPLTREQYLQLRSYIPRYSPKDPSW